MINESKVLEVKNNLGNVNLVVASKYYNTFEIEQFISYGITNFGENRVDSLLDKYEILKDKVTWHFIGHLQKNKASKIINKIDYLHSLDSIELAKIIDKLRDKPLNCFVEVKLVDSTTKSGIDISSLDSFLNQLKSFKNINVIGLMVMTNIDDDFDRRINVFNTAKQLCIKYNLPELSAGMSSDYLCAIKTGATWVRLGKIFME